VRFAPVTYSGKILKKAGFRYCNKEVSGVHPFGYDPGTAGPALP
jgi:hypothetical protein